MIYSTTKQEEKLSIVQYLLVNEIPFQHLQPFKTHKSKTLITIMSDNPEKNWPRSVSTWARDSAIQGDRHEEPFENADGGLLTAADEKWKIMKAIHLRPLDNLVKAGPTDMGRAESAYQAEGFQIVETTLGYTIRPINSNYQERVFFPYPALNRIEALELQDLATQALNHFRISQDLVPGSVAARTIDEADFTAGGKLYSHWNAVCELIDQIEQKTAWPDAYDFCKQKSDFCLGSAIRLCADDALNVFAYPDTGSSAPLSIHSNLLQDLMPSLEKSLGFVLAELARMVTNLPDASKKTEANGKVTSRGGKPVYVRGRLTNSCWGASSMDARERSEAEACLPRSQSIFHEKELPFDERIASGEAGVAAGMEVRGSIPNTVRPVLSPFKGVKKRLSADARSQKDI